MSDRILTQGLDQVKLEKSEKTISWKWQRQAQPRGLESIASAAHRAVISL